MQTPHSQSATAHDDAHSNAALAMAGLAGHKIDSSQYPPPPTLRNGSSVDLSYSPEDTSQMGNELTALFEMAGAYAQQNGNANANGNVSTPAMEFGTFGDGANASLEDGDLGMGMGFNAMFGNEPEFSRIMNELL